MGLFSGVWTREYMDNFAYAQRSYFLQTMDDFERHWSSFALLPLQGASFDQPRTKAQEIYFTILDYLW